MKKSLRNPIARRLDEGLAVRALVPRRSTALLVSAAAVLAACDGSRRSEPTVAQSSADALAASASASIAVVEALPSAKCVDSAEAPVASASASATKPGGSPAVVIRPSHGMRTAGVPPHPRGSTDPLDPFGD